MSTAVDSANLILKLYELRREEVMRKARDYMFGFNPNNVEEYMAGMMGPNSAHIRMFMSYWEMAASLVNAGAIDAKMFNEANGEHVVAFSKVDLFIEPLRAAFGSQDLYHNLQKVCYDAPNGKEKVALTRERMRAMAARFAEAPANQAKA
jgi:hypothetical protein